MLLRKIFIFILFVFFSSLAFPQECLLIEIPFSQKVNNSSLVIEGEVISQKSFWNTEHTRIYTTNVIEVYKIFKGKINSDKIELITLGGKVGNENLEIYPSETADIGQTGIFFCNELETKSKTQSSIVSYQFYGWSQGFIRYNLYDLSAYTPFQNYKNINEIYGLITLQTNSSYQTIKTVNWKTKNSGLRMTPPVISSFSPNPINAGAENILTITGSNFGTTKGAVFFRDASSGGSSTTTPVSSQYISWTDNEIKVQVPSRAGTGTIQVQNSGGENTTSSSALTIDYSILNDVTATNAYIRDLFDQNGAGGYTWQYANNFVATPNAVASFERALQTWTCTTFVNWRVGNSTSVDMAAVDGTNIVRWNSSMPAGVLGWYLRYSDLCVSGTTTEAPSPELDIEFSTAFNWEFGTASPSASEVDFESVAVHELGHAHQLGHIIASGRVMHYSIGYGMSKRILNAVSEIAGGNFVMAKSIQSNLCSGNPMVALTPSNCAVTAPLANFSANSLQVCPGGTVLFTDNSLGNPTSWNWSFPGGTPSSSTSQNPTVTYSTAGTYNVTLMVSNINGKDTLIKTAYITVALPTAVISGNATIYTGNSAYLSVAFTGKPPYSFTYFDGTSPQTISGINTNPYLFLVSPSVTTTYTLTAMNDADCAGTFSGSATVTVQAGTSNNNGLVACYPFEGNADDAVGNNDGTVTGAVLTTDRFGSSNNAYKFDGFSGDHIDLGIDSVLRASSMTISLWVLIDSNDYYYNAYNAQPFIVARNTNYPGGWFEAYSIMYHRATSKFVVATYQSGTTSGPEIFSINTVNLKQWYHLVLTFDDNFTSFYVDGVLQGKVAKGFTTTYAANSPVMIGFTGNAAKEGYLNGKIDNVKIFNRVLSDSEIVSIPDECISTNCNQSTFQKIYGGTGDEEGLSILEESDGGLVMSGRTNSFGSGNDDVYVLKTDKSGSMIWSKAFGGINRDLSTNFQKTSDGGYIFTGLTESFGSGFNDFFLTKTDVNGNISWSKVFGGSSFETSYHVLQTNDGGYILAGGSSSFGSSSYEMYIVKTDNNGNILWQTSLDATDKYSASHIIQTAGGDYVISGFSLDASSNYNGAIVLKLNSAGNVLWAKKYSNSEDAAFSIYPTSDNGFILTGNTKSINSVSYDILLLKIDSNGNQIWAKAMGGTQQDRGYSLIELPNGNIVTDASTFSFLNAGNDHCIMETDLNGNLKWFKTYRQSTVVIIRNSLTQTQDGGLALIGLVAGGAGGYDLSLIKTNACGESFCNEIDFTSSIVVNSITLVVTDLTMSSDLTGSTQTPTFTESNPNTIQNTQCASCSASQSTFQKTYGGTGNEEAHAILANTDGTFMMAGETNSFGSGNKDGYVIKTNSKGEILWEKTYGGSSADVIRSIEPTSDGGYILGGWTQSFGAGGNDLYLIKTDADGNTQWSKTYGTSSSEDGGYVHLTPDGGYIISGTQGSSGSWDFYMTKTDATGNMQWAKSYSRSSNNDYVGYSVVANDGGYLIGGATYNFGAGMFYDMYCIKTDSLGNVQWDKNFQEVNYAAIYFIQKLSDGGFLLVGSKDYQPATDEDIYLIKMNPAGDTVWTKYIGGSVRTQGISAFEKSDGNILIGGYTNSFGNGGQDIFMAELDNNGNLQWFKTYGGTGDDFSGIGQIIGEAKDGGIVLAGKTNSFGAGGDDIYFIKTDACGDVGCNMTDTIPQIYFAPLTISDPATTASSSGTENTAATSTVVSSSLVDTLCQNSPPQDTCNLTVSFLASDTILCSSDSIFFTNTSVNATAYQWKINGINYSTNANIAYYFNTPGIYQVTLIASNSTCSDSVTKTINLLNVIAAFMVNDTLVCDSASLFFTNTSIGATQFEWRINSVFYSNTKDVFITFNSAGSYLITLIASGLSCSNTFSRNITVIDNFIADAWNDTTICFGDSVQLFASPGISHFWFPAIGLSDTNIANPFAKTIITTTYGVVVTAYGCPPDTAYVNISIQPLNVVTAGTDITINAGEQTQLNACCGSSYVWTPSTGLSCTDCANPFANPELTTTYTVTVFDSLNCKNSDTVIVFVETGFFIPNIFSPNGDNNNDRFQLYGFGIKEINFRIYNRWGELVWEAKDINEAFNIGWDGTYKGALQPNGVFVWHLNAKYSDGREVDYNGKKTGTILLTR